jgi:hypothetical protein
MDLKEFILQYSDAVAIGDSAKAAKLLKENPDEEFLQAATTIDRLSTRCRVRPAISRFADKMEEVMLVNGADLSYREGEIGDMLKQMNRHLVMMGAAVTSHDKARIVDEAVQAATQLMMIADKIVFATDPR